MWSPWSRCFGNIWGWASPRILGFCVLVAVSLGLFVWAERRATEPVLPLRLFENGVFRTSSFVGFVVGFAMFGAITYLPLCGHQPEALLEDQPAP